MRRAAGICAALSALVLLSACGLGAYAPESTPAETESTYVQPEESAQMRINVQVGEKVFHAALEDNAAARALAEMLPLTLELDDYGGFEKVGTLGTGLPARDSRITTAPGDIVLYNGSQIVMFYGSNTWSYTRLGRIEDLSGWEDALGAGAVTVTLTMED